MFSESVLVFFLLIFSAQNSSLWSSLMLIPMSSLLVYCFMSTGVLSGSYVYMYIMIFIGGLLVLLVSIASISYQEQGYNLSKGWLLVVIGFILPLLFEFKSWNMTTSLTPMGVWLESQSSLISFLVVLLLVALFTISGPILTFKGFIRSI